MEARESLGIADEVLAVFDGEQIVITKPNNEQGKPISKNVKECGPSGVVGSIADCGSAGPGSNPGLGPGKGDEKSPEGMCPPRDAESRLGPYTR